MRLSTEHRFVSHDGVELFYRRWQAVQDADRAIILFHRGHEHSARLQDVVDKLDLPALHMFAWDARGHGRSPGERGYAENFGILVKDVDCFVRHVSKTYRIPMSNIVIMAHSVGSVVASTWVHDYAPPIRALVLGSPALRVRLYVPFAIPALRVLLKLKGKAYLNSYVKAKLLTHDPAKIAAYNNDLLITRAIAVNILVGLFDAGTRLMKDAGAIHVPTIMLVSGADWVVEQQAQHWFFNGLPAATKEAHVFPGFFHDTFNEKDNHLPLGKARDFINRAFERAPVTPSLLNAHRAGYTRDEYDRLKQPLPALSLKALQFGITRLIMGTLGRLSDGVRIGFETGFDSGTTLDYIYRNQAHGITPLGTLIDRNYLDSIGWRGIRIRKANLEKLLRQTIERVHQAGQPVRIVDIAAGHGRYVLDVIKNMTHIPLHALLRDYSPLNIESGSKLAQSMGLSNVTYQQGDAFNQAALAALSPRPSIAIVSGLYELFPDNAMISGSLAGLGNAIEPGGYLIYTNQPWHPQVELIARVLTSHRDGEPWIMRRRTQAEMDQLVAAAGFEKIEQEIDEFGIFSVTVARKK